VQDKKIRDHIRKDFSSAGIPRIEIERSGEAVNVIIFSARPGVLVGRKGVRVEQLKKDLQDITGMTCHLTLHEVKRPELEAKLVAEVIAEALEKRMAFRRAIKRAIQTTMQSGAKGVKVEVSGRLGGAEMARTAKEREGRVPLSTLQSQVDYGTANGRTSYGIIGVKVWIYKGEIERTSDAVNVIIYTARPGVLVGRQGVRVEELKKDLQKITGTTCHLTLHEVKRPELESKLVAEVVAEALEKRMAFRRATKRAMQTTLQAGAKGVKIELNGRLGGAEMARQSKEREASRRWHQTCAARGARRRRSRARPRWASTPSSSSITPTASSSTASRCDATSPRPSGGIVPR
jgi:small subunit ribosomal protein S3